MAWQLPGKSDDWDRDTGDLSAFGDTTYISLDSLQPVLDHHQQPAPGDRHPLFPDQAFAEAPSDRWDGASRQIITNGPSHPPHRRSRNPADEPRSTGLWSEGASNKDVELNPVCGVSHPGAVGSPWDHRRGFTPTLHPKPQVKKVRPPRDEPGTPVLAAPT